MAINAQLSRLTALTVLLVLNRYGYATESADERLAGTSGPPSLEPAGSTPGDPLFLEVSINGEPTHEVVSFMERSGSLWVLADDLLTLGIQPALGGNPGPDVARGAAAGRPSSQTGTRSWMDLGRIAGLRYELDRSNQAIDLRVADSLRRRLHVGGTASVAPKPLSSTGFVLNYDALAQSSDLLSSARSFFSLGTEQRLFNAAGVFSNTGIWTCCGPEARYIRESTYFQHDDPDRLTTYQVGDGLTSSLSWTRAVRFAGVQVRTNFALDPQLITFPMPAVAGTAAVPSTVDLYVNNVRQYSGAVPSGPFIVDRPVGLTGAGLATLVVRDDLGHAVTTSLPVYIDNRLLAAGTVSYSFEAGLLRYDFGRASADYAGNGAISASYRRGLSEVLTLESHGEASGSLLSSGVGALFEVARAGVIHVALSGSSQTDNRGGQYLLGYQLVLPAMSISLQSQRSLGDYRDLGSLRSVAPPRRVDQVAICTAIRPEQTLAASYVGLRDSVAGRSEILSLSYSAQVFRATSVFVSLSADRAQHDSAAVWIGISAALGQRTSGWADFGAGEHGTHYGASVMRAPDYAGGWNWGVQAQRGDAFAGVARVGYLGNYGEVAATANTIANHAGFTAEGSGGLVVMDGTLEAARRIGAGFALVSTDGIGGVSVLHENRVIGSTDAGGHLLVPDLNPYGANKLAIDAVTVPPEATFTEGREEVSPRGNSGVLVDFKLTRVRAVTVILRDVSGQVIPAGTPVTHVESDEALVVGYGGQVFIEHPGLHNHLHIAAGGRACIAQFEFPSSVRYGITDLGAITCLRAEDRPI